MKYAHEKVECIPRTPRGYLSRYNINYNLYDDVVVVVVVVIVVVVLVVVGDQTSPVNLYICKRTTEDI